MGSRIASLAGLVALALALPAQGVRVNEMHTGATDFVELLNLGPAPVDVGGWTVESWHRAGLALPLTPDPSFVLPLGTVLAPGAFLLLQELGLAGAPGSLGSCALHTGFNYAWDATDAVELVLRDAAGGGVDYLYRNPFAGSGPSAPHLPAGTSWSGTLLTVGENISRASCQDTDTASDWVVASGSSACLPNPGQRRITLSLSTSGQGDASISVVSCPPLPAGEIFNFYSTIDFIPNGSGPFFGVGFDALPQIYLPLLPGSPFHTSLDGGGALSLGFPPGTLPPGLFLEGVSVVLFGGALHGPSEVAEILF